jgi:hypothetical protein
MHAYSLGPLLSLDEGQYGGNSPSLKCVMATPSPALSPLSPFRRVPPSHAHHSASAFDSFSSVRPASPTPVWTRYWRSADSATLMSYDRRRAHHRTRPLVSAIF